MVNIHDYIYSDDFKLSQSRLKNLLYGNPNGFIWRNDSGDTPASLLGRITETLLLERELFNEKFKVVDLTPPTAQMGEFVEHLLKFPNVDYEEILQGAFDTVGIKRGSLETFTKRFEIEGKEYYEQMLEVINTKKSIVTSDLVNKANELVNCALGDERFMELITLKKNESIHVQELLYFMYMGEPCIALPDLYKVNDLTRKITLVDIKTTSKNPKTAAKDNRWDIQGSFYKKALEQNYPGYIVDKVFYYVLRTDSIQRPIMLQLTDIDLLIGEVGANVQGGLYEFEGFDYRTYYSIIGFKQLVERFKWHRDNDEWELSREEVEQGVSQLNLFTGENGEYVVKT